MLRGVHTKINFSLNLSRVDLKVFPVKEETIAHHLQFFPIFLNTRYFAIDFLESLNFAVEWCEAISVAGVLLLYFRFFKIRLNI